MQAQLKCVNFNGDHALACHPVRQFHEFRGNVVHGGPCRHDVTAAEHERVGMTAGTKPFELGAAEFCQFPLPTDRCGICSQAQGQRQLLFHVMPAQRFDTHAYLWQSLFKPTLTAQHPSLSQTDCATKVIPGPWFGERIRGEDVLDLFPSATQEQQLKVTTNYQSGMNRRGVAAGA